MIPIGIYRASDHMILNNEKPYILTNPEKSCLLLKGDMVYVLGDSQKQNKSRTSQMREGIIAHKEQKN